MTLDLMRRWFLSAVVVSGAAVALGVVPVDWESLWAILADAWGVVAPGGKLHPAAFLEHKGHLLVESALVVAILYLLVLPRKKPKLKETLTEQEVEQLCQEWQPQPLIPEDFAESPDMDVVIESAVGHYVKIDGREFLNMDGNDFLGLLTDPQIQEACKQCIERYGVGSCGPRAFYGTMDVHLRLEQHIAQFLGVQESIVYSFDIATVPSVLPAFANRKDIIVLDEAVHYPIQSGAQLSRAQVLTFKHNDMTDLERLLDEIDQKYRAAKKPLNRRFIMVEGIYHDRGDVAPLKEIYRLKCKYKYRLIVDESLAIGVLGKTGRGACEAFGLLPSQVDLITASLSHAMAATGGFCAGDHDVIGHQRLNGNGYIFSASLPPFLAAAADRALTRLEENPAKLAALQQKAAFMREQLSQLKGLRLVHDVPSSLSSVSPVICLELADGSDAATARLKLQKIARHLREASGIVVSVPSFSGLEWRVPTPSLRLTVSVRHPQQELLRVKNAIAEAGDAALV